MQREIMENGTSSRGGVPDTFNVVTCAWRSARNRRRMRSKRLRLKAPRDSDRKSFNTTPYPYDGSQVRGSSEILMWRWRARLRGRLNGRGDTDEPRKVPSRSEDVDVDGDESFPNVACGVFSRTRLGPSPASLIRRFSTLLCENEAQSFIAYGVEGLSWFHGRRVASGSSFIRCTHTEAAVCSIPRMYSTVSYDHLLDDLQFNCPFSRAFLGAYSLQDARVTAAHIATGNKAFYVNVHRSVRVSRFVPLPPLKMFCIVILDSSPILGSSIHDHFDVITLAFHASFAGALQIERLETLKRKAV
ncbi:hypothetical protein AB1N83_013797 [Pleurotus pulmonarius]